MAGTPPSLKDDADHEAEAEGRSRPVSAAVVESNEIYDKPSQYGQQTTTTTGQ